MDVLLIAFVVAFLVSILVIVLVIAAIRADREIFTRGALATVDYLNSSVADLIEQRDTLRKELSQIHDQQVDLDALRRQIEETNSEWAQLEERRQDIQEVRNETEHSFSALSEVKRDLNDKAAELEHVEHRLKHANKLISKIELLERQATQLEEQVAKLRVESIDLTSLKREYQLLSDRVGQLQRDEERIICALDELTKRKQHSESSLKTASVKLETILADLQDASVRLTSTRTRIDEFEATREKLREEVNLLERNKSGLIAEIERLELTKMDSEQLSKAASDRSRQMNEKLELSRSKLSSSQIELAGIERQRAQLLAQIENLRREITESGINPLADLERKPSFVQQLLETPSGEESISELKSLENAKKAIKDAGLNYSDRLIRAFHTAMKVNETAQMAVLAGISGTGKSQLPRNYAKAMGIGFVQISVQPRWDSPQDLMGFYNYMERRFQPTELARALFHLDRFNERSEDKDLHDRVLLILLDEMNLARVEYYFSDFLSRLENRPPLKNLNNSVGRQDSELELDIREKDGEPAIRIFPGYNILFAGTMNEDESTQSLSDKVIDRANIIRFASPKKISSTASEIEMQEFTPLTYQQWGEWIRTASSLPKEIREEAVKKIKQLLDIMAQLKRPFGHRLGNAMLAYVANYPKYHEDEENINFKNALADQVEMRLLPKLRGIEVEYADAALETLEQFVRNDLDDPSLADAVRESADEANNEAGQFVWRGFTR